MHDLHDFGLENKVSICHKERIVNIAHVLQAVSTI